MLNPRVQDEQSPEFRVFWVAMLLNLPWFKAYSNDTRGRIHVQDYALSGSATGLARYGRTEPVNQVKRQCPNSQYSIYTSKPVVYLSVHFELTWTAFRHTRTSPLSRSIATFRYSANEMTYNDNNGTFMSSEDLIGADRTLQNGDCP